MKIIIKQTNGCNTWFQDGGAKPVGRLGTALAGGLAHHPVQTNDYCCFLLNSSNSSVRVCVLYWLYQNSAPFCFHVTETSRFHIGIHNCVFVLIGQQ